MQSPAGAWEVLDQGFSSSSRLLEEDVIHGFFPYKAEEVVGIICREFATKQTPVELVFEGPSDEYEELAEICGLDAFREHVSLEAGERFLPNAQDVLPDIVEVFHQVEPLAYESVRECAGIEDDLKKFLEVSSDLIPICVVGNYSVGKSTFINALIGQELLPSGDLPETARVFQIQRSRQAGVGTISFACAGKDASLSFAEGRAVECSGSIVGTNLEERILRATKNAEDESFIAQMRECLRVLNRHSADPGEELSDTVQIEVPFFEGDDWGGSRSFAIFDTPGSNAAFNEDHLQVLRNAMRGLSNGLPVFLSVSDQINSRDNLALYQEVAQIENIDQRFAMLVINKADLADLPKKGFTAEQREDIKDSVLYSKLHAQGAYYVAASPALGAKTAGELASDNYAERYDDFRLKNSDPSSRYYKRLYTYDILPAQIARRVCEESEACEDRVLANSGLYCIEREIARFGNRYSAYDKCARSRGLIHRIVTSTKQEMEQAKVSYERSKHDLEQELDAGKRELLREIDDWCENAKSRAVDGYDERMSPSAQADRWFVSREHLRSRNETLTREAGEEHGLGGLDRERDEALRSILPTMRDRLEQGVDAQSLRHAFQGVRDELQSAASTQRKIQDAERDADHDAAERLFVELGNAYSQRMSEALELMESVSQAYWKGCADEGRRAILEIATGSTVLSEEKRTEIEQIVINYRDFSYAPQEFLCIDDFKQRLRIFDYVIGDSERLDLMRLAHAFNQQVEETVGRIRRIVERSHRTSFEQWLKGLQSNITENLIDYNPALHVTSEGIRESGEKIATLEGKLTILRDYESQIEQSIEWRPRPWA